jgi:hypothetical protein
LASTFSVSQFVHCSLNGFDIGDFSVLSTNVVDGTVVAVLPHCRFWQRGMDSLWKAKLFNGATF